MIPISQRRKQLQARLDDLQSRLVRIEGELDSRESTDWEESAIEHEDDEVLEGIGNSGLLEIRQIEAALERMDAGEYGLCVTCGERISDERLDVLPYTPFCRNCAP